MSASVSAYEMAWIYWVKLRHAALKEVQAKLTSYAKATESTRIYWLRVHEHLERVSCEARARQEAKSAKRAAAERQERVAQ